jgi:hypothetical protein
MAKPISTAVITAGVVSLENTANFTGIVGICAMVESASVVLTASRMETKPTLTVVVQNAADVLLEWSATVTLTVSLAIASKEPVQDAAMELKTLAKTELIATMIQLTSVVTSFALSANATISRKIGNQHTCRREENKKTKKASRFDPLTPLCSHESDTDCGGPFCDRCGTGDSCRDDSDCELIFGECVDGTCVSYNDGGLFKIFPFFCFCFFFFF